MSSPKNLSNSSRVGTRVVLREITASLHNSTPIQSSRRKSGNDSSVAKTAEHEVKVRFAREFADVGSVAYSVPEGLSSASSFQSLSSTLSTKSSSGITPDSVSLSPNETTNTSYVSANIPGVEDLILGCADIHLGSDDEQSFNAFQNSQDLSQDQTFASATDEPNTSISTDFPSEISLDDSDKVSQVIENRSTVEEESTYSSSNRTQDIQERPILEVSNSNSNILETEEPNEQREPKESKEVSVSCIENSNDISNSIPTCDFPNGIEEVSLPELNIEEPNLNNTVCLSPAKTSSDAANSEESVSLENTSTDTVLSPVIVPVTSISSVPAEPDYAEDPSLPSISTTSYLRADSGVKFEEGDVTDSPKNLLHRTSSPVNNPKEEINSSSQDELRSPVREIVNKDSNQVEIFSPSPCNISNDGESFKCPLNVTPLPTPKCELFQDPTCFDFLIAHGNSNTTDRLRAESLYVKFDPLVENTSMLPQGNSQPINEEQNGKDESSPTPNIDTPKRNPAIAAIDRLLFYSPVPTNTIKKMEEPQKKIEQPVEEPKQEDTPLISDVNMSKELELVRATVLQLEEELEKEKKEHKTELERQKNSFQEKINKLQAQMAQEVKSKSQMTVVVDEYEKSISRLLTERERDRTNFEQEKAKLQEELHATNVHLANTEAAFNDVHQKYERLKGVVSAYKNNEAVLKESIQENMETIKGLEQRYDQMKNHAMAQLEKANLELDAIRKQHEDETVKLHAMVRKADVKSNSLAELLEQKTKEVKELTQILDEVIARVGHQTTQ